MSVDETGYGKSQPKPRGTMLEPGKFYLFACPFFWTFVGRYVRQANFQEIIIDQAGYFTRPGATFDVLCTKGMQSESNFHSCSALGELLIPAQGPKFPWLAPTPWTQEADHERRTGTARRRGQ